MSRRPTRSPPPETLLRTTGHAIFTIAADFILRRNYDAVDHVLNNGLLKLFDSSPILVFRILGEVLLARIVSTKSLEGLRAYLEYAKEENKTLPICDSSSLPFDDGPSSRERILRLLNLYRRLSMSKSPHLAAIVREQLILIAAWVTLGDSVQLVPRCLRPRLHATFRDVIIASMNHRLPEVLAYPHLLTPTGDMRITPFVFEAHKQFMPLGPNRDSPSHQSHQTTNSASSSSFPTSPFTTTSPSSLSSSSSSSSDFKDRSSIDNGTSYFAMPYDIEGRVSPSYLNRLRDWQRSSDWADLSWTHASTDRPDTLSSSSTSSSSTSSSSGSFPSSTSISSRPSLHRTLDLVDRIEEGIENGNIERQTDGIPFKMRLSLRSGLLLSWATELLLHQLRHLSFLSTSDKPEGWDDDTPPPPPPPPSVIGSVPDCPPPPLTLDEDLLPTAEKWASMIRDRQQIQRVLRMVLRERKRIERDGKRRVEEREARKQRKGKKGRSDVLDRIEKEKSGKKDRKEKVDKKEKSSEISAMVRREGHREGYESVTEERGIDIDGRGEREKSDSYVKRKRSRREMDAASTDSNDNIDDDYSEAKRRNGRVLGAVDDVELRRLERKEASQSDSEDRGSVVVDRTTRKRRRLNDGGSDGIYERKTDEEGMDEDGSGNARGQTGSTGKRQKRRKNKKDKKDKRNKKAKSQNNRKESDEDNDAHIPYPPPPPLRQPSTPPHPSMKPPIPSPLRSPTSGRTSTTGGMLNSSNTNRRRSRMNLSSSSESDNDSSINNSRINTDKDNNSKRKEHTDSEGDTPTPRTRSYSGFGSQRGLSASLSYSINNSASSDDSDHITLGQSQHRMQSRTGGELALKHRTQSRSLSGDDEEEEEEHQPTDGGLLSLPLPPSSSSSSSDTETGSEKQLPTYRSYRGFSQATLSPTSSPFSQSTSSSSTPSSLSLSHHFRRPGKDGDTQRSDDSETDQNERVSTLKRYSFSQLQSAQDSASSSSDSSESKSSSSDDDEDDDMPALPPYKRRFTSQNASVETEEDEDEDYTGSDDDSDADRPPHRKRFRSSSGIQSDDSVYSAGSRGIRRKGRPSNINQPTAYVDIELAVAQMEVKEPVLKQTGYFRCVAAHMHAKAAHQEATAALQRTMAIIPSDAVVMMSTSPFLSWKTLPGNPFAVFLQALRNHEYHIPTNQSNGIPVEHEDDHGERNQRGQRQGQGQGGLPEQHSKKGLGRGRPRRYDISDDMVKMAAYKNACKDYVHWCNEYARACKQLIVAQRQYHADYAEYKALLKSWEEGRRRWWDDHHQEKAKAIHAVPQILRRYNNLAPRALKLLNDVIRFRPNAEGAIYAITRLLHQYAQVGCVALLAAGIIQKTSLSAEVQMRMAASQSQAARRALTQSQMEMDHDYDYPIEPSPSSLMPTVAKDDTSSGRGRGRRGGRGGQRGGGRGGRRNKKGSDWQGPLVDSEELLAGLREGVKDEHKDGTTSVRGKKRANSKRGGGAGIGEAEDVMKAEGDQEDMPGQGRRRNQGQSGTSVSGWQGEGTVADPLRITQEVVRNIDKQLLSVTQIIKDMGLDDDDDLTLGDKLRIANQVRLKAKKMVSYDPLWVRSMTEVIDEVIAIDQDEAEDRDGSRRMVVERDVDDHQLDIERAARVIVNKSIRESYGIKSETDEEKSLQDVQSHPDQHQQEQQQQMLPSPIGLEEGLGQQSIQSSSSSSSSLPPPLERVTGHDDGDTAVEDWGMLLDRARKAVQLEQGTEQRTGNTQGQAIIIDDANGNDDLTTLSRTHDPVGTDEIGHHPPSIDTGIASLTLPQRSHKGPRITFATFVPPPELANVDVWELVRGGDVGERVALKLHELVVRRLTRQGYERQRADGQDVGDGMNSMVDDHSLVGNGVEHGEGIQDSMSMRSRIETEAQAIVQRELRRAALCLHPETHEPLRHRLTGDGLKRYSLMNALYAAGLWSWNDLVKQYRCGTGSVVGTGKTSIRTDNRTSSSRSEESAVIKNEDIGWVEEDVYGPLERIDVDQERVEIAGQKKKAEKNKKKKKLIKRKDQGKMMEGGLDDEDEEAEEVDDELKSQHAPDEGLGRFIDPALGDTNAFNPLLAVMPRKRLIALMVLCRLLGCVGDEDTKNKDKTKNKEKRNIDQQEEEKEEEARERATSQAGMYSLNYISKRLWNADVDRLSRSRRTAIRQLDTAYDLLSQSINRTLGPTRSALRSKSNVYDPYTKEKAGRYQDDGYNDDWTLGIKSIGQNVKSLLRSADDVKSDGLNRLVDEAARVYAMAGHTALSHAELQARVVKAVSKHASIRTYIPTLPRFNGPAADAADFTSSSSSSSAYSSSSSSSSSIKRHASYSAFSMPPPSHTPFSQYRMSYIDDYLKDNRVLVELFNANGLGTAGNADGILECERRSLERQAGMNASSSTSTTSSSRSALVAPSSLFTSALSTSYGTNTAGLSGDATSTAGLVAFDVWSVDRARAVADACLQYTNNATSSCDPNTGGNLTRRVSWHPSSQGYGDYGQIEPHGNNHGDIHNDTTKIDRSFIHPKILQLWRKALGFAEVSESLSSTSSSVSSSSSTLGGLQTPYDLLSDYLPPSGAIPVTGLLVPPPALLRGYASTSEAIKCQSDAGNGDSGERRHGDGDTDKPVDLVQLAVSMKIASKQSKSATRIAERKVDVVGNAMDPARASSSSSSTPGAEEDKTYFVVMTRDGPRPWQSAPPVRLVGLSRDMIEAMRRVVFSADDDNTNNNTNGNQSFSLMDSLSMYNPISSSSQSSVSSSLLDSTLFAHPTRLLDYLIYSLPERFTSSSSSPSSSASLPPALPPRASQHTSDASVRAGVAAFVIAYDYYRAHPLDPDGNQSIQEQKNADADEEPVPHTQKRKRRRRRVPNPASPNQSLSTLLGDKSKTDIDGDNGEVGDASPDFSVLGVFTSPPSDDELDALVQAAIEEEEGDGGMAASSGQGVYHGSNEDDDDDDDDDHSITSQHSAANDGIVVKDASVTYATHEETSRDAPQSEDADEENEEGMTESLGHADIVSVHDEHDIALLDKGEGAPSELELLATKRDPTPAELGETDIPPLRDDTSIELLRLFTAAADWAPLPNSWPSNVLVTLPSSQLLARILPALLPRPVGADGLPIPDQDIVKAKSGDASSSTSSLPSSSQSSSSQHYDSYHTGSSSSQSSSSSPSSPFTLFDINQVEDNIISQPKIPPYFAPLLFLDRLCVERIQRGYPLSPFVLAMYNSLLWSAFLAAFPIPSPNPASLPQRPLRMPRAPPEWLIAGLLSLQLLELSHDPASFDALYRITLLQSLCSQSSSSLVTSSFLHDRLDCADLYSDTPTWTIQSVANEWLHSTDCVLARKSTLVGDAKREVIAAHLSSIVGTTYANSKEAAFNYKFSADVMMLQTHGYSNIGSMAITRMKLTSYLPPTSLYSLPGDLPTTSLINYNPLAPVALDGSDPYIKQYYPFPPPPLTASEQISQRKQLLHQLRIAKYKLRRIPRPYRQMDCVYIYSPPNDPPAPDPPLPVLPPRFYLATILSEVAARYLDTAVVDPLRNGVDSVQSSYHLLPVGTTLSGTLSGSADISLPTHALLRRERQLQLELHSFASTFPPPPRSLPTRTAFVWYMLALSTCRLARFAPPTAIRAVIPSSLGDVPVSTLVSTSNLTSVLAERQHAFVQSIAKSWKYREPHFRPFKIFHEDFLPQDGGEPYIHPKLKLYGYDEMYVAKLKEIGAWPPMGGRLRGEGTSCRDSNDDNNNSSSSSSSSSSVEECTDRSRWRRLSERDWDAVISSGLTDIHLVRTLSDPRPGVPMPNWNGTEPDSKHGKMSSKEMKRLKAQAKKLERFQNASENRRRRWVAEKLKAKRTGGDDDIDGDAVEDVGDDDDGRDARMSDGEDEEMDSLGMNGGDGNVEMGTMLDGHVLPSHEGMMGHDNSPRGVVDQGDGVLLSSPRQTAPPTISTPSPLTVPMSLVNQALNQYNASNHERHIRRLTRLEYYPWINVPTFDPVIVAAGSKPAVYIPRVPVKHQPRLTTPLYSSTTTQPLSTKKGAKSKSTRDSNRSLLELPQSSLSSSTSNDSNASFGEMTDIPSTNVEQLLMTQPIAPQSNTSSSHRSLLIKTEGKVTADHMGDNYGEEGEANAELAAMLQAVEEEEEQTNPSGGPRTNAADEEMMARQAAVETALLLEAEKSKVKKEKKTRNRRHPEEEDPETDDEAENSFVSIAKRIIHADRLTTHAKQLATHHEAKWQHASHTPFSSLSPSDTTSCHRLCSCFRSRWTNRLRWWRRSIPHLRGLSPILNQVILNTMRDDNPYPRNQCSVDHGLSPNNPLDQQFPSFATLLSSLPHVYCDSFGSAMLHIRRCALTAALFLGRLSPLSYHAAVLSISPSDTYVAMQSARTIAGNSKGSRPRHSKQQKRRKEEEEEEEDFFDQNPFRMK